MFSDKISCLFSLIRDMSDVNLPFCSLFSGVSLPEGQWPVMHQRTLTSPGRIQKVMVKSTNIAVSPTGREADK